LRSQQRLFQTATWFSIWTSLATVAAVSAVIGYGGKSVMAGTLSVGSLVAFYGFVAQLFEPLSGASELYARAQKTFASIRQVQAALELEPSVRSRADALTISKHAKADLEFLSVQFGYRRNRDLLDIPFLRISEGSQIAIAGENGAGKSTLAKLMARLYDPVSGSVRLSGQDIRNVHLKSLRQAVCYLPRDPALFSGSLKTNLLLVRPGTSDQEIREALDVVGLAGLVRSLPHGLEEQIGPDGCQLSGGERQRLALARALLQRPKVVILDEATSCLDASSEFTILHNLRRVLDHSTFIVVSHRQSTLSIFPRIIVLSQGGIIEDGNRIRTRSAEEFSKLTV
jgi:ABC-type bacteriocin/lantibiotic exporter with double-glycine peptidase domain